MSDRSVHAPGMTGSIVVCGHHDTVTGTIHVILPPADIVDAKTELVGLREALARLQVSNRNRLDRAFKDAEEEAAKPSPDKEQVLSR